MHENDRRRYKHESNKKIIETVTRSLKWLFTGWTSRTFIQMIDKLPELQPELELIEEDEEEDEYDDEDDEN